MVLQSAGALPPLLRLENVMSKQEEIGRGEKSAFLWELPIPSTEDRYFVFEKLKDNSWDSATTKFGLVSFSFSPFSGY